VRRKNVPKQVKETRQYSKGEHHDLEKTHGFHLSTLCEGKFFVKGFRAEPAGVLHFRYKITKK